MRDGNGEVYVMNADGERAAEPDATQGRELMRKPATGPSSR
jgi:hypothetical protein